MKVVSDQPSSLDLSAIKMKKMHFNDTSIIAEFLKCIFIPNFDLNYFTQSMLSKSRILWLKERTWILYNGQNLTISVHRIE